MLDTTTKQKDKAHSEFSASGSERWLNCPASVKRSRKAPPQKDTPWSIEGIIAHEHLSKWLLHLRSSPLAYEIPKELSDNENMKDAVKSAVDFINSIWKRKYQDLLIEERVSLEFVAPDLFGTTDIGLVEVYNDLQIWDYKHGKGHAVDVYEKENGKLKLNTQLVYYALGAAKLYNNEFQRVRLGIIQPRASHKDGPKRAITVSIKEVLKYEDIFKKGVDEALKPNPKYQVGRWCFFCPDRPTCPKQEKIKQDKTINDFVDYD